MTDHKTAIETQKRKARLASAKDANEIKLAEVESAVIASKTALETEETQMRADGKYADGFIVTHMANRKTMSQSYIDKLRTDIVEPIAKQTEDAAKATVTELPERTPIHIEASQHYAALDSDRRQEAIGCAITGKDDVLAVALIIGRDPITDITYEQLMNRLSPGDDQKDKVLNIAKRLQATFTTIEGASR